MSDIEIELQTESLVLIKMLLSYRPSLAEELTLNAAKTNDTKGSSASVEVVWRGELQRRFFHVPDLCGYIAEATKARFVEKVPRDSQESKLLALLEVCSQVYREVKHQELLNEKGIADYANAEMIDALSWLAFLCAFALNMCMLVMYTTTEFTGNLGDDANPLYNDDYPKRRPLRPRFLDYNVETSVSMLTYAYMAVVVVVIILLIIVRAPVRLESFQEQGYGKWAAITSTAMDPLVIYYLLFLGLAVLGVFITPAFLTFLLLDIVSKNATTQDVLKAITYPYKQLIIAAILMFTIQYTTAFFVFRYFSTADHLFDPMFCETVWKCFKDHLFWGIGGDIGDDHSSLNTGDRYVLDIGYFLLMFIMLNIVGGIMIDTFSELRTLMIERIHETENFCFICGIENVTFDRSIGRGAFKHHISQCHHMWDYLKFIIYIWEQDKDDDDGLEQYVRRCIEANDISWFPINKSLDLVIDEEATEGDLLKQQWEMELTSFEKATQNLAKSLQVDFMSKAVPIQEELEK